ncbi:uncharacterized protein At1g32220, chloroplastic [Raphanus sativus]|uniref:Uncharacterized protein At1g32220, chloroplastic n=1 Tax=Raphanus sativus TaxID=3726 RepID=A0A9W3BRZ5_RAPSA|nr:uncharacterized protein At1g32220, chloroplastic [Raphanus sativus]XP_056842090.1 uncharacterized protein At1g32220, chloroplastic [Raphanus sativus]
MLKLRLTLWQISNPKGLGCSSWRQWFRWLIYLQSSNLLRNRGDVFYLNWDEVLLGATAVVSTIGGFGNEQQMKRINGEANVISVNAAKDFGVTKFVLITVHDYNLPPFVLSCGVVLRPGLIYGNEKLMDSRSRLIW